MLSDASPMTLAHLNLDVADLERSERFYRDVLSLPVMRRDGSLVIRWTGGLLVLALGTPSISGTFHFGLRVATDAEVDRWFSRFSTISHVTVVEAPIDRGAVYVGRITDPDGYPIEIYADREH